ncbi:hypothetical protein DLJ53_21795 [Acuticoccus sediminis]|uniref:Peptidase C51 domain-containing protein n=1 Tax=Acuticoccus sediminis TaxID=2184697 RepID=A0A8B2NPR3_9HYPH|nr:TIGR02594 family protein [Acuticoccus sediminis]RAH99182.1 hypothetical protein DLJ53_21795 [Acuticoccus sediminis]
MAAIERAPWLDYLIDHIGLKEIPGPENNPLIVAWGQQSGIDWWNNDDDAWCAVAVNGALVNAGYPSTRSALARSFCKYGTRLSRPVRGAIVVFPRGTNPLFGHVGIVDEVRSDGTIVVVNGNVSNMVRRSTFRISSILPDGIRWPPGAPMDGQVAAIPTTVELGERILERGMSGDDVEDLQVGLAALGHIGGADEVDGIFGPNTEDAVRAFQRSIGLTIDGLAGPATLSALDRAVQGAANKVKAREAAKAAAKPAAATAGGLGAVGGVAATAAAVSSAARDVGGLWDGTALGLGFVAIIVAGGLGFLAYRYFTSKAADEAAA